jgi:hypothetical protein
VSLAGPFPLRRLYRPSPETTVLFKNACDIVGTKLKALSSGEYVVHSARADQGVPMARSCLPSVTAGS